MKHLECFLVTLVHGREPNVGLSGVFAKHVGVIAAGVRLPLLPPFTSLSVGRMLDGARLVQFQRGFLVQLEAAM